MRGTPRLETGLQETVIQAETRSEGGNLGWREVGLLQQEHVMEIPIGILLASAVSRCRGVSRMTVIGQREITHLEPNPFSVSVKDSHQSGLELAGMGRLEVDKLYERDRGRILSTSRALTLGDVEPRWSRGHECHIDALVPRVRPSVLPQAIRDEREEPISTGSILCVFDIMQLDSKRSVDGRRPDGRLIHCRQDWIGFRILVEVEVEVDGRRIGRIAGEVASRYAHYAHDPHQYEREYGQVPSASAAFAEGGMRFSPIESSREGGE